MKTYEELTEVERALVSLIFAVETKDKIHPDHPPEIAQYAGEAFLAHKLEQVKAVANKLGIPLKSPIFNKTKNVKVHLANGVIIEMSFINGESDEEILNNYKIGTLKNSSILKEDMQIIVKVDIL
jgi:hypothetical protein